MKAVVLFSPCFKQQYLKAQYKAFRVMVVHYFIYLPLKVEKCLFSQSQKIIIKVILAPCTTIPAYFLKWHKVTVYKYYLSFVHSKHSWSETFRKQHKLICHYCIRIVQYIGFSFYLSIPAVSTEKINEDTKYNQIKICSIRIRITPSTWSQYQQIPCHKKVGIVYQ